MHKVINLHLLTILLCLSSVYGEANDNLMTLSTGITQLTFNEDGSMRSWWLNSPGRGEIEILSDEQAPLFVLQISKKSNDISPMVRWSHSKTGKNSITFIGALEKPGIQIRREFNLALNSASITMQTEIENTDEIELSDIAITLDLGESLHHHSPNDGSLADLFYGYDFKYTGEQLLSPEKGLVDSSLKKIDLALVSRHIAVVVTEAGNGSSAAPFIMVPPEEPIKVLTQNFSLAPKSMTHVSLEIMTFPLVGKEIKQTRFERLIFGGLFWWLRPVAFLIERFLQAVDQLIGNMGYAVIVLAIFIRIITLPLNLWSNIQNQEFTSIQAKMAPGIREIKQKYKGAEESERILELYKSHSISPLSGLKGSMGLFIQLPILVAIFNVTTESAIFRNESLLWINDLSMPDQAFALPFAILGIGGFLNLLPIILGSINILSTKRQRYNNPESSKGANWTALLMTLLIVFLFYSFAAAVVLYWMTINLIQVIESEYLSKQRKNSFNSKGT